MAAMIRPSFEGGKCVNDEEETRRELSEMVRRFAARISLARATWTAPEPGRRLDNDLVWRWVQGLQRAELRRPMMRFAGWLWNTGVHDSEAVIELLRDAWRKQPRLPYAYYAPEREGRECALARFFSDRADRENRDFKAADLAFLELSASSDSSATAGEEQFSPSRLKSQFTAQAACQSSPHSRGSEELTSGDREQA